MSPVKNKGTTKVGAIAKKVQERRFKSGMGM